MFRFHTRNRSLIPVKDMEKTERCYFHIQEVPTEDDASEPQTPRQRRNLSMIYLLFLAEAIMASSLSSQIHVLMPFSTGCLTMNTSFLRGILQCAYFFGSATGIIWGLAVDRFGRRRVALMGLGGMSACCVSMGFATSFFSFALLRFVAGAISSAVTVSGLAMLADFTHGSNSRTRIVSRLPLVAVCGQLGPMLSSSILHFAQGQFSGLFAQFPGLVGQIACAGLVFTITLAEVFLLDETLPQTPKKSTHTEEYADCEKASFLGQMASHESEESLNISIIEALALDDSPRPSPSSISITHMLTAPSILTLLASFSVLSLHASTFDVMLPHLGHNSTSTGGMGMPCSWLSATMLIIKALAAVRIMHVVPFIVHRVGLLQMYRRISLVFPILYVIIPLVALTTTATGASPILAAFVSTLATLAKTTLAGAAQVLVLLLALSSAPDASSTGTLLGVVSISELFKALAVGLAAVSYYLSDDYSMLVVNCSLWAALATTAVVGAFITRRLREASPRVGTDLPEECFAWQGMFDAESDDDLGF